MRWMTVPLFAGFVFGIFGMLAAGSVEYTLREFASEGGVNRLIFVAVPGLFAMMFALVVYQHAEKRISTVAQSLSRGVLVAFECAALVFHSAHRFWGHRRRANADRGARRRRPGRLADQATPTALDHDRLMRRP